MWESGTLITTLSVTYMLMSFDDTAAPEGVEENEATEEEAVEEAETDSE
jgi:hypothetical protein